MPPLPRLHKPNAYKKIIVDNSKNDSKIWKKASHLVCRARRDKFNDI